MTTSIIDLRYFKPENPYNHTPGFQGHRQQDILKSP